MNNVAGEWAFMSYGYYIFFVKNFNIICINFIIYIKKILSTWFGIDLQAQQTWRINNWEYPTTTLAHANSYWTCGNVSFIFI